ncbi:hypothetical protein DSO57_1028107 [Entomophthora muscae]|uniref:Uncharacterized protein n=1 Tax=Entomophthora muscae TaxID=34485 RepID=A0ACC2SQM0_9FUNG|nr:hypothetical protein DSO57_1028107 [Entomophthora muscae]
MGRFAYLGHLCHLAMITVPIGSVIDGLNLGALVHQPAQRHIPDIKRIILLQLTRESGNYKEATALVGMDPKYTSKTFNTFINTGKSLLRRNPCVFPPCSPRSTNGQSSSG